MPRRRPHLERRLGHRGGQRAAAKRAAVLPAPDGQHDGVVGQDGRDGEGAARQRLAQDGDVSLAGFFFGGGGWGSGGSMPACWLTDDLGSWLTTPPLLQCPSPPATHPRVVPLLRQHPPRPRQPGLDLVGDEQRAVAPQQRVRRGEVAGLRDQHAGLPLDGLHHKGDDGGVGLGGGEGGGLTDVALSMVDQGRFGGSGAVGMGALFFLQVGPTLSLASRAARSLKGMSPKPGM
jgi:hypothetical protein